MSPVASTTVTVGISTHEGMLLFLYLSLATAAAGDNPLSPLLPTTPIDVHALPQTAQRRRLRSTLAHPRSLLGSVTCGNSLNTFFAGSPIAGYIKASV